MATTVTIPNPLPVTASSPLSVTGVGSKYVGNLGSGSTVPSNSFAVASYVCNTTYRPATQIFIGAGNSIPSTFLDPDGNTWKLLFSSVPYFTNS